jgi:hypothetical protein
MNKRVHKLIEQAALPDACADCVRRVVKGTRLWTRERCDVASELIAHFQDGIEAGAPPDELVQNFGNEKAAAKLIRRAKIRCRPWWWQAKRWFGRTLAAFVVVYALLIVWFVSGEPAIDTDYLTKLNAHAVAVPDDQRAWPLYQAALAALPQEYDDLVSYSPGDEKWDDLVKMVRDHQPALETLRRAARKPGLGFLDGGEFAEYDADQQPPLLEAVELPGDYLGDVRRVARWLAADARVAAVEGDGGRVVDDLTAILGVADHAIERPFLVNSLVAISTRAIMFKRLGGIVLDQPDALTDAQLRDLAHRLGAHRQRSLVKIEGERFAMMDRFQRMYTADGRLTDEWIRTNSVPGEGQAIASALVGPLAMMMIAPRQQMLAEYERFMGRIERAMDVPLRDMPSNGIAEEIEQWSDRKKIRYLPVTMMMVVAPAFDALRKTCAQEQAMIDGVLIGVALELYRRQHDHWPRRLEELVPHYLPAVLIDRITGEPLRYRVTEGSPIVYSVGVDCDDDSGRAGDMSLQRGAVQWFTDEQYPQRQAAGTLPDGDWVLWPSSQ